MNKNIFKSVTGRLMVMAHRPMRKVLASNQQSEQNSNPQKVNSKF